MTAAVGAAVVRDEQPKPGRWPESTERWARWTFFAVVAVAVPVILYQGRDQWFFLDEWDFLANRQAGSFHDLMTPHVEHWTAFGIVVYRALWSVVGLNHYWPYQLCTVALHLAAAVMLRTVMRRAGVHPWIATTAAILFVFLGSGRQNIVFAFQIAFTGALAFGLAHILLADHDGRFDRRDLVGIVFGVLALMCSAVGVTMAVGAGVAICIRRGWRLALAHVAPLAAVFALWWLTFGRDSNSPPRPDATGAATFVRQVFFTAFDGMGQIPGVGIGLGVAVVIGIALALSGQTWVEFRRLDGPTIGLAVTAVTFAILTAYGRVNVSAGVPASRYVHLVVALSLPIVALALSAFVARWRATLPVALALLLIGVPGNIAKLDAANAGEALSLGSPSLVLTMAHMPLAREVPADLRPFQVPQGDFPIGWLVDAVADGKVPPAPKANALVQARAELLLSVYQTDAPPLGPCRDLVPDVPVIVHRGDAITITGRAVILHNRTNGGQSADMRYDRALGTSLQIVGDSLDVTVEAVPPEKPAQLCR